MSQFYGGPCLVGAAVAANTFVTIDASQTPDDIRPLASDTGALLGVATQALEVGDQAIGVVTGQDVVVEIQMASGVSAAAMTFVTATTGGEAKAAATGDVRHAQVLEPVAAGGIARCKLWFEASLVPA